MVIELTLKCYENCTHCMVNANENGHEMNLKTLKETVNFMRKIKPYLLQLSGGEISLHSQYRFFIEYFVKALPEVKFVLESNGSWFEDQKHIDNFKALCRFQNVYALQIRTDERYYPNYRRIWQNKAQIEAVHPKISVFEGAIELIPLGRAKNLISENPNKSPQCANLILLNRQKKFKSFSEFIEMMQENGKFCTPSIDIDGFIHAGETPTCIKIGHVTDNLNVLMASIQGLDFCGRCNLNIVAEHIKRIQ